jgi:hypothetical protein
VIGIWTDSQLIPVDVPSLQRISEAALMIAESESLVFEPLKSELELMRSLTALLEPLVIVNAVLNETEQELPVVGLQLPAEEDPHVAFVFASIRLVEKAVVPDEAA